MYLPLKVKQIASPVPGLVGGQKNVNLCAFLRDQCQVLGGNYPRNGTNCYKPWRQSLQGGNARQTTRDNNTMSIRTLLLESHNPNILILYPLDAASHPPPRSIHDNQSVFRHCQVSPKRHISVDGFGLISLLPKRCGLNPVSILHLLTLWS